MQRHTRPTDSARQPIPPGTANEKTQKLQKRGARTLSLKWTTDRAWGCTLRFCAANRRAFLCCIWRRRAISLSGSSTALLEAWCSSELSASAAAVPLRGINCGITWARSSGVTFALIAPYQVQQTPLCHQSLPNIVHVLLRAACTCDRHGNGRSAGHVARYTCRMGRGW